MSIGATSSSYPPVYDPIAPVRQALAGRFDIGDEIGRGGMAYVYRATDLKHNRTVALKVLRPELAAAVGSERFLREINIEAKLSHPHILPLLDSGEADFSLYYLMPWADGGSLRDRLRRETQMSLEDAIKVIQEIGGALAYAHKNAIVHRDVKPENIVFLSGHAQLADFGIASAIADTSQGALTETGLAIGTPAYMSPEQASPNGKVDSRSDQYALACVLFEMLAGEPPFSGRTTQAIVARHLTEPAPSLSVVRPDLSPSTVAVIKKALEKSPAARFSTMDQFVEALTLSVTQPITVEFLVPKKRLIFGAIAAAVVFVVAIVFWPGAAPALSANKIAVFPLSTRGLRAADSGLGVGVEFLLEAALERASPLQLVDVVSLLSEAELNNMQGVSDRKAQRIARTVGAGFSIRGVLQQHTDSTTVLLRLYKTAGDSLVQVASAAGLAGTPIHHLAIDALVRLLPQIVDPSRPVDFAPLRDRRLQGIALWMQGERAYRFAQFDSARMFYERALADDSLLALAAVKGAQAASWTHQPARATQLAEQAVRLASQLPPKYAAMARGINDYVNARSDLAVAGLRTAMSLDPSWAEPAVALAEVYIHQLPVDRPLDSLAREALQIAVTRDGGFTPPLYHLAADALVRGQLRDADRYIARMERERSEPALVRQLKLIRTCVARPTDAVWLVTGPESAIDLMPAAKLLSAGLQQPECAEGALRTVLRSTFSSTSDRWGAFLGLEGLLVARGEDTEATALLDSTVAAGKGVARSLYIVNSIAGAAMRDNADTLESFARRTYGEQYERVTDPERLWAMAAWNGYRGNAPRVIAVAETLTARANRSNERRTAVFAEAARAQAALARGDTAGAIDLFQRMSAPTSPGYLTWSFGDALPVERLLLAQLLLARQQYRESIRAASVFDHPEAIMFLPYVAQSLRIRLQASRAINASQAVALYRRRLERLGRADLIASAEQARR